MTSWAYSSNNKRIQAFRHDDPWSETTQTSKKSGNTTETLLEKCIFLLVEDEFHFRCALFKVLNVIPSN
jgi:hypothetical protein